jgi:hypothetical protein
MHPHVAVGEWRATEEPDWGPLERLLPMGLCGPFMWMGEVELEDGRRLRIYKHSFSRRYLHLDEESGPYRYVEPDRYVRLRHYDAVELVFTPTWLLYEARDGDDDLLGQALEAAVARDERESQSGLDVPPL